MKLDDINDVRYRLDGLEQAMSELWCEHHGPDYLTKQTLSREVETALDKIDKAIDAAENELAAEPVEVICDASGCTQLVAESEAHKCDCGNKVCDLHWEGDMCTDCKEAGEEIPPDSGVDEEIRAIQRERGL
jgi:tetrahydromethanopterin S-methyltransferase subunit G